MISFIASPKIQIELLKAPTSKPSGPSVLEKASFIRLSFRKGGQPEVKLYSILYSFNSLLSTPLLDVCSRCLFEIYVCASLPPMHETYMYMNLLCSSIETMLALHCACTVPSQKRAHRWCTLHWAKIGGWANI